MKPLSARVLLAEDHPLYREGLVQALEHGIAGLRCVAVGSAREVIDTLVHDTQFDALLADLKLPDGDGLALVTQVRQRWPTLACILVSGNEDPRVVERAIALGCMGFVPKALAPGVMVDILARVLAGEPYFPQPGQSIASSLRFTARQLAVLDYVARGLTSRAIAAELGIAERTVKDHLAVIYARLDASTRAQAVARAGTLGLIDFSRPG